MARDRDARRRRRGWRGAELIGIVLIALGIVYLLGELGIVQVAWGVIWPILVIAVGAILLLGAVRPGRRVSTTAEVPVEGSGRLELDLSVGAGRFRLEGGATPGRLVEVASNYDDIATRIERVGDRAVVRLRQDLAWWPDAWRGGADWTVRLASEVPTMLTMNAGAGEFLLDLSGARRGRGPAPDRGGPDLADPAPAAWDRRDPADRGCRPVRPACAAWGRVPARDKRGPDLGGRPDRVAGIRGRGRSRSGPLLRGSGFRPDRLSRASGGERSRGRASDRPADGRRLALDEGDLDPAGRAGQAVGELVEARPERLGAPGAVQDDRGIAGVRGLVHGPIVAGRRDSSRVTAVRAGESVGRCPG